MGSLGGSPGSQTQDRSGGSNFHVHRWTPETFQAPRSPRPGPTPKWKSEGDPRPPTPEGSILFQASSGSSEVPLRQDRSPYRTPFGATPVLQLHPQLDSEVGEDPSRSRLGSYSPHADPLVHPGLSRRTRYVSLATRTPVPLFLIPTVPAEGEDGGKTEPASERRRPTGPDQVGEWRRGRVGSRILRETGGELG